MNYYNKNTNKIRRKKISTSNIDKQIEINRNINKKENIKNNNLKSSRKSRIRNKKKKHKILKSLLIISLICLILCSILGSFMVFLSLKDSPKITKKLIEENYISSQVINVEDIPSNLKNALVAIEDERFYEHSGVDIKSLLRSVVHNVFTDTTQGGSTIEMQISKNLLTNNDRSIKRKIRDIYNAIQMDKIISKEEILGIYLNNVYFGKSSYGVAKASKAYFGEDVRNLDLAQCAMLVGITNNPAKYSQYSEAKKRQETILYKMNKLGYITDTEYKNALKEKVTFKSEIE